MDQQGERRELFNGFGNGLSQAFEIALTPAVFGGLGYLLDRWLGIMPVLTITLFLFAIAGNFVRIWIGYEQRMKAEEARRPWTPGGSRPRVSTSAAPATTGPVSTESTPAGSRTR